MCTSFRYTPKVAKSFGLEEKDIHPSDKCLVLTRNQKKMVPFGYKTNNLILNARQETLLEKPLFKDSMHCIVPAGSFYEWDLGKNKVEFYCDHILYFAGILIDNHLVIVTTNANAHVKPVHSRMPVILEKEDIDPWLKDISKSYPNQALHFKESSYKNHFSKGDLMNITEFQKSRFGLIIH